MESLLLKKKERREKENNDMFQIFSKDKLLNQSVTISPVTIILGFWYPWA